MADDILSPILLVPDFTHLYVIDSFDSAFARQTHNNKSGTWESQKKDIKTILQNGNDEDSHHFDVYKYYNKSVPITKLEESCTLLEETDSNNRWTLTFRYKGIKRELIYFHHTNFYNQWPSEIKEISDLMSMGAVFMTDKDGLFQFEYKEFFDMLTERTIADCLYYELYNIWYVQHDMYKHKKQYKMADVRNTTIIISELQDELYKQQ